MECCRIDLTEVAFRMINHSTYLTIHFRVRYMYYQNPKALMLKLSAKEHLSSVRTMDGIYLIKIASCVLRGIHVVAPRLPMDLHQYTRGLWRLDIINNGWNL